jgi:hypothetical protein
VNLVFGELLCIFASHRLRGKATRLTVATPFDIHQPPS